MFYKPGTPHNLPRDPFKACVIPRPIGWISSISGGEPFWTAPRNAPYLLLTHTPPSQTACTT
jgi:hypothetical protein